MLTTLDGDASTNRNNNTLKTVKLAPPKLSTVEQSL